MNININRPISPHLTIYKVELTTALSIMHRITGVALSIALCIFIVLLKLVSFNLTSYTFYSIIYILNNFSGFILLAVGFLLLGATVYHLLTGIRHLIWDTGSALELNEMNLSAYIISGLVIIFTVLIWIIF